eukprot:TRINITY_DN189_c0_g1_i1.p1 TRINITY_DN189_c0_g1~~TRINITY_DN189_c0_g1_i1.p1  ORF type:complete len:152 (+),score=57.64 TRINITY_DN189_c0_g1_i1:28-483(+)
MLTFGRRFAQSLTASPMMANTFSRAFSVFYTKEHEWAKVEDDSTASFGITDYAQNQMGEIVYVDLPEEGDDLTQFESYGSMESVKAASDLYAPFSGKVLEVNTNIGDEPGLLNNDSMGEGWTVKIELSSADEVENLMKENDYTKFVEECDH